MRFLLILAVTLLLAATAPLQAQVIQRYYHGFTLWIDCDRRGAVMFE